MEVKVTVDRLEEGTAVLLIRPEEEKSQKRVENLINKLRNKNNNE